MSISSDSNFITPAGAAPEPEDASIGQSTQNPYQCAETNPIHATTAGRSYWTATLLGTSTKGTRMRKFRDLDNGHYFIWNGTLPKSTKRKDPGVCKKLTARTFQSETDQVFKLTPEEVELEADRQAKPRAAT